MCVHGRTKEQNKHSVGACDWNAIRAIKLACPTIPVFANGGIETYEDVQTCLRETGVDGVMSSESILEVPGLFSQDINSKTQQRHSIYDQVEEYLEFATVHGQASKDPKCVKAHLFKFLHQELKVHTDSREALARARDFDSLVSVAHQILAQVRAKPSLTKTPELSWYRRHRNTRTISRPAERRPPLEAIPVVIETPEPVAKKHRHG